MRPHPELLSQSPLDERGLNHGFERAFELIYDGEVSEDKARSLAESGVDSFDT